MAYSLICAVTQLETEVSEVRRRRSDTSPVLDKKYQVGLQLYADGENVLYSSFRALTGVKLIPASVCRQRHSACTCTVGRV